MGFKLNPVFHIVHDASFRDDGFTGVEFDFDQLHVVAENGVVNLMTFSDHLYFLSC